MDSLIKTLRYEVWILLVGLAALFAYRLLTGGIRVTGLLYDKSAGRGERGPGAFSPARLQLLVVTVAGALYYMTMVFRGVEPGHFPVVPKWLLMGVGGSHAFYLGGKLFPLLQRALGAARGGK